MRLVEGVADVGDVDEFVAWLDGVGDEYGCVLQAFDAAYVADRRHLESAVEHAHRAFDRGENVASERAVEILLYAAGRRQIRRALEMGVSEGEQEVVVVVDGAGTAGGPGERDGDEAGAAGAVTQRLDDRGVLGGDPGTLRAFFDVSDAELAAADADLPGIVRERVALLDVEK